MKGFCFGLTATAIFLVTLAGRGLACSPGEVSLYEPFSKHSKVFLGSVRERTKDAASGQGIYTIFVDEVFKGVPNQSKGGSKIAVILSENEQCAVGTPKETGKILVFMNDGDVVNATSHSSLIWREAEQTETHLNPVMDDLVILRRMLFPKHQGGVVPDEDTALHLALKALIPVFGRVEVSKHIPFKVTYLADKLHSEDRVWRVVGTPNRQNNKSSHCRSGNFGAEINRWTGDIVRVFSCD
jgi:hypothetical protein